MTTAILGGGTSGRAILEIIQDVATKIGLDQPAQVYGSSDRTAIELGEAAIEAADKIARAHDWQALHLLETHQGDGTTTEFVTPPDMERMPKDGQVWSTRWEHPLLHVTPEDWLHLDIREYDTIVGTWTLFGGNFVYRPALADGENAKFWYITNLCVNNAEGATKQRFTKDDDVFRLDDRVLELVMIWVWRAQKGLDYAEDMHNAEIALAREISDDRGARILTQQSRRNTRAKIAYPWTITP